MQMIYYYPLICHFYCIFFLSDLMSRLRKHIKKWAAMRFGERTYTGRMLRSDFSTRKQSC